MKTISIRKDFGIYDVSDEEDVSIIINEINIELDNEITLDLSGCLIDYPATSKLIDSILEQIKSISGEKTLNIITNFVLPIPTIANWLFLGSKMLKMETIKGLSLDEILCLAENSLCDTGIILNIIVRDIEGNNVNEITIPSTTC